MKTNKNNKKQQKTNKKPTKNKQKTTKTNKKQTKNKQKTNKFVFFTNYICNKLLLLKKLI